MKTPPENNAPSLPLPGTCSTKPITQSHASAAQIAAALGFDDLDETFLRNRVREGIIPKPRNSLYDINATTIGLLKYYRARAIAKSDLPEKYPSMDRMATSLGITVKAIKWLLKNGAAEAQDDHHRVTPLPILRRAFAIIEQIADGHVTGLDGFEQWNHQTELAKKLRLESAKLRDEELIRKGNLLFSTDGTAAVERLTADELLGDLCERPLRGGLVRLAKSLKRQHKNLFKTHAGANAPEAIRQSETLITTAFDELLAKIRQKIPAAKTETIEES